MDKKLTFIYLDETDLTDEQIKITQRSYRENAQSYAMDYERNMNVNGTVIYKNLVPFLNQFEQNKNMGTILFAGCGSCRDLQFCENSGFQCLGIDTSKQLLDIAKEQGVKSLLSAVDIFKYDFIPNSLGGIYCDTALTHSTRGNLSKGLRIFHNALKKNGVLFMEFRRGDGKIYRTIDNFGERYYITYPLKDAKKTIKAAGFKINSVKVDQHPIIGRPDFIAIIATKV